MTYKVDDWVVHPQHGVGQVVKLEMRKFCSGSEQMYYKISITDGTIWVQVEGSSCGLRKLTSKKELDTYRDLLRSRPSPLNENHRQLQIEIIERLSQGSFSAKCEVVRDLTAHGWYKPLGDGNARLLRNTYQAVNEEWTLVGGLSRREATLEIETLLQEGKQKFMEKK